MGKYLDISSVPFMCTGGGFIDRNRRSKIQLNNNLLCGWPL